MVFLQYAEQSGRQSCEKIYCRLPCVVIQSTTTKPLVQLSCGRLGTAIQYSFFLIQPFRGKSNIGLNICDLAQALGKLKS
jgi:hypothetical protein